MELNNRQLYIDAINCFLFRKTAALILIYMDIFFNCFQNHFSRRTHLISLLMLHYIQFSIFVAL